jgi:hypothetical protein
LSSAGQPLDVTDTPAAAICPARQTLCAMPDGRESEDIPPAEAVSGSVLILLLWKLAEVKFD